MIRTALLAAALVAASGCASPRAQASMAQALSDAATEMGSLKNDISQLQTDLDSLKTVVAKQDTLINRIAAVNGIPK